MKRAMIVLIMCLPTWAAATEVDLHLPIAADKQPHPLLSSDSSWAGVMIILVLGMFLAAVGVGIAVQLNPPEEVPPEPAKDEHGHGGGHGHGH
jgi:uncharacterized membrane protein YczE